MTCREKVAEIEPEAINSIMIAGVAGCPHDYFDIKQPDYCKPVESICTKCWDREIPSEEMEVENVDEEMKRLHILEGRIEAVKDYVDSGSFLSVDTILTLLGIEKKQKGKADNDAI